MKLRTFSLIVALTYPVNLLAAASLEEIIVTAERRATGAQDVPLAVTVFTSEMVEKLEIDDFSDLAANVPGFSLSAFTKTWMNPALRGGSTSLVSAGAEQAVGMYIDDVYFGGAADFTVDLFDVERIEVLRGPQGTLFGRNTTGGAINVITRDPNLESVEAKASVTHGNYNLLQTRGLLSGPLADTVGGIISFATTNRQGTSWNSVTSQHVDNINRAAVRGKVLWQARDDLEVKFGLTYSKADETGVARDIIAPSPFVPITHAPLADFVPDRDPRTVQMDSDGRYSNEQYAASMHITKDLTNSTLFNGELLSITTGRHFDSDETPMSITGTPQPIYNNANPKETKAYSQEFRFVSDYDGRFNWVGGLFFYQSDETRRVETDFHWATSNSGGFLQAVAGCPVQTSADTEAFQISQACVTQYPELFEPSHYNLIEAVETTSTAVYAQGTYDLLENMTISLGGRFTADEKRLDGRTSGDFDFVWNPVPGSVLRDKDSWDEFTWKSALQWWPAEQVMLYGSASTGFRSGAYAIGQGDPALLDKPVAPETVISYEAGVKSRFLDNRMQVNLTGFRAKYEDLQFFIQSAGSLGVAQTTNAGEATIEGVEVDLQWAITPTLRYAMSYVYQSGDSSGIPEGAQEDVPLGTPPAGTVPHTYSMMFDYSKDIGDGELTLNLNFTHKDEYTLEFVDNSVPGFRSETEADIGASIGYRFGNGVSLKAWGKNLLDNDVVLYGQDFYFGLYDVFTTFVTNPEVQNSSWGPRYADPRTFGLTLAFEY